MSTQVIVGQQVIDFPDQGDSPAWGEAMTAFATAVADQLQATQSIFDVAPTVSQLATSTITNQTLTSFASGSIRAYQFVYAIYRTNGIGADSIAEEGFLSGVYDTINATWNLEHEFNGKRATDGTMLNTFNMSGDDLRLSCAELTGGTYDGSTSTISFFAKCNLVSEI